MSTRLDPSERYARILKAAVRLAEKSHYCQITRKQIAEHAGCAPTLVTSYFGNMHTLRKRLMQEAVDNSNTVVVMQGLALSDPIAKRAPPALRKKAAARINA